MLTKTEVIVLGGVRYSDNASIVTCYSEQLGTIPFKCIRSSSQRGRANAFFMPLSILSVSLDYHPSRAIQTPREQQLLYRPIRPSADPTANAVALFTIELLTRLLRTYGTDPLLYRYLRKELQALDSFSDRGVSSFHLRLIVGLLHHLGILPNTDRYREGDLLDFSEGSFRAAMQHDDPHASNVSKLLYQFITTPHPEELPLTAPDRNALLELLLEYLRYYYPDIGTIRSPEVLRQLF